mgnify:CR=1 FL=1
MTNKPHSGRVALVTGAARGIGVGGVVHDSVLLSQGGRVCVGLTADGASLPDLDELLAALDAAFCELLAE